MGERGNFTKRGFEKSTQGLSDLQETESFEVLRAKGAVRSSLLSARMRLPQEGVDKLSEQIKENLLNLKLFGAAKTIALYYPVKNEVKTQGVFINAKESGKEIYFPRVEGGSLKFLRVCDLSELEPGKFGIPEPPRDRKKIEIQDIELVVIPGVAFDLSGRRLGYGKGYYDRAISGVARKKRIGLAYSFQLLDMVPAEIGDERVGVVVTESGVIFCEGG
ncbi:MAG TPA: 5-formyltetrahydrofolate cyclo-ligase [Thermodesulfobacteriota bacterium]|nr:5-formyltetrahydrofolate cyclo-ligase [Thermodesulfobacteriota bacterium]